jgi:hypothetical protein
MTNVDIINLVIGWLPMLVVLIIWGVFFRFNKRVGARQKESLELSRRIADTLERIEQKLNG